MEGLFVDSLFVSYHQQVPSQERIPYNHGDALTQEILHRLAGQIRSGGVRSVQLDDETRENGLAADFQDGWATVYIVRDGPTPKKHATEDMGLIAEILLHFAQTGEVYPDCAWEHTLH